MLYYLQGTNIISKDESGQIKCSDFAPTSYSDSYRGQFIQKEIYTETVCSIAEIIKQTSEKDTDTLILNAKYFRLPGLVKAIFEQASPALLIKSDIDFIINSQQLKSGDYTFVDILENETNIYKFTVENNMHSISSKYKTDNTKLKRSLADAMKANEKENMFFNTLFSFRNIISVNQYLKKNELNQEDFADCNFSSSDVEIGKFTKANLATFFEVIALVIDNSIAINSSNQSTTILKSPLTSYLPIAKIAKSNSNSIIINELELLKNSTITNSIKNTHSEANYELKYFPDSKRKQLPVSIWLLSETENLSFQILKTTDKENVLFHINLSELKNRLSNSFFSVGNKLLVKYLVELKNDCCNNLHLRIQTLDKEEFYHLVNDQTV